MRLELLDSLSIPGDPAKPNEDSFSHTENAAAVFDGTTGLGECLMPGRSDAQWIAQFGARRLRAHAQSGEGELRDWLRAAAADAEKSYRALRKRAPIENYEIAYASAVMATPDADGLQILWFGDCAALLRNASGEFVILGDIMDKREGERARVRQLWKPGGRGPAAAACARNFCRRCGFRATWSIRRAAIGCLRDVAAPTMPSKRASRRWWIRPSSWRATASRFGQRL
jgi:hypothetical protein